ncbi:hypothetical protein NST41_32940 [Paenibacillus sp. FSL L8-0696]|uniref:hypothetical protein n=1 Tax=Paenibacillus sp. FSL L8-0696 TaxID=2954524 RepID=UPI00311A721C
MQPVRNDRRRQLLRDLCLLPEDDGRLNNVPASFWNQLVSNINKSNLYLISSLA